MKVAAFALAALATAASAAPLRIITLVPVEDAPALSFVPHVEVDSARTWEHLPSLDNEAEAEHPGLRAPCGRHGRGPNAPVLSLGTPPLRSFWPANLRELFVSLGMRSSGRVSHHRHHHHEDQHVQLDDHEGTDKWHSRVEALMTEAAARADSIRMPSVAMPLPEDGERQRLASWKALEGKDGIKAHHHHQALPVAHHQHDEEHSHVQHLGHHEPHHHHHHHEHHGHHGHHEHHFHAHMHGHRRPAVSFRARLHRAVWSLQPAEALAIAFVVGAGLGSIVHFFFMVFLLSMRRFMCGSYAERRARRAARREERKQRKAERKAEKWARKSKEGRIKLIEEDALPVYEEQAVEVESVDVEKA